VDSEFFRRQRRPAAPPYILCVSTLHPHKNLDRLLHAFSIFHGQRPEFRLVLAGMRGFHADELECLRDSLGLADAVEFTAWIPRERLYEMYAGASAFVYPSLFEGFGMPVLEALALGLPTGCSRIEPLAGVAGDAALLFDPENTADMVEAMHRLTADDELRAKLRAAGPLRAGQFSWEAAARETLEAIRAATGRCSVTHYKHNAEP
jgi:glycosyltransferase involved in cell wall biosynthesis